MDLKICLAQKMLAIRLLPAQLTGLAALNMLLQIITRPVTGAKTHGGKVL
jgi:hypothetical protein